MAHKLLHSATNGVLNLQIARLESQLRVLLQQQQLSAAYPHHQAKLAEKALQIEYQLQQLLNSSQRANNTL